jgi:hypothetical protein
VEIRTLVQWGKLYVSSPNPSFILIPARGLEETFGIDADEEGVRRVAWLYVLASNPKDYHSPIEKH